MGTRGADVPAATALRLGDGLWAPRDLLLERGFVAGSPKTGKTSTCVVLVEEADRLNIASVVITPNDVWHGLRSAANGEDPGLEHVIFGGSFGDRPLQAGMGRGLARAVADGLRMVLVTARMSLDDRATLVADFLEELLEVNRSPLLVVVDEAHRFAPGGSGASPARKRCREAMINTAATGRMPAYLGFWFVTQRLAMLATDLRELANASIVHRLRGTNDIKFARPWLENYLDDPAVLERIGKLDRGEAFVVAPDAGDLAGVYQIRPKWTFDTSNSDDAFEGKRPEPKGRSTIDLSALDATLGEALREAEEHDPEALRRRVAELQARLDKADANGGDPAEIASLRERAEGAETQARQLQEELMSARGALADAQAELDAARSATDLVATLRRALTALLGDVTIAQAAAGGEGYPGDQHVLGLIRAHAPAAAGGPALMPVEALRADYLERTAQRLVTIVSDLEADEREALLFLLGHQTFISINATAKALTGNDSGSTRARWSKALQSLVAKGLAAKGGSGGMGRKADVEAWVRTQLGPHGPTDEEVAAVRDRALSVLQQGQETRHG